jgi:hypothetical protein
MRSPRPAGGTLRVKPRISKVTKSGRAVAGQRSGQQQRDRDGDHRDEDRDLDRGHRPHRSLRCIHSCSSCVVIQWRLAAFVGHLLADVGYLGAHLEQDALDAAPDRKITTRRAACRQARQVRQRDTGNAVDQCIDIRPAHQFVPLLLDPDAQQCRLWRPCLRGSCDFDNLLRSRGGPP